MRCSPKRELFLPSSPQRRSARSARRAPGAVSNHNYITYYTNYGDIEIERSRERERERERKRERERERERESALMIEPTPGRSVGDDDASCFGDDDYCDGDDADADRA